MPRLPFHRLWIGIVLELVCVALMNRHGNFLEQGEPTKFTTLAVMAGVGFWVAVRGLQGVMTPVKSHARLVWLVAVALRLVMLPTVPGDDLWRYRWEGNVQLYGYNPYVLAPDSPALAGLRDADWSRINHQDVPAIYPPLAELLFAGLAWTGNSVWLYKLLFTLADLGIVGVLRSLLARRRWSPDAAAWYAWNPLAIYTSAGAAHFDALMVLATLGAVWCLDRLPARPTSPDGAAVWRVPFLAWMSAGFLGVAIALKTVPAVLLSVWFFALGWRRATVTLPLAAGLPPALALLYGFPGVPVFGTLARFARGPRVNDAFWWIVDPTENLGRLYGPATAVVCLALAIILRHDWRRAALWVIGAALLLSPAIHAWYVLWVLPLAVWRGEDARAWVVLSASVFGYFLLWETNHASGRAWEEPLWLRALVYLPPLLALGVSLFVRPSAHAGGENPCYPAR